MSLMSQLSSFNKSELTHTTTKVTTRGDLQSSVTPLKRIIFDLAAHPNYWCKTHNKSKEFITSLQCSYTDKGFDSHRSDYLKITVIQDSPKPNGSEPVAYLDTYLSSMSKTECKPDIVILCENWSNDVWRHLDLQSSEILNCISKVCIKYGVFIRK